jgi:hypothetical protein
LRKRLECENAGIVNNERKSEVRKTIEFSISDENSPKMRN